MSVVDLAEARAKLAADRQLAEAVGARLANFLVSEAFRQAERAFAAASSIASDKALALIIYRGVIRQLRADVRRAFGGQPVETQHWALEEAEGLYRGRIFALMDERDARARTAEGRT